MVRCPDGHAHKSLCLIPLRLLDMKDDAGEDPSHRHGATELIWLVGSIHIDMIVVLRRNSSSIRDREEETHGT